MKTQQKVGVVVKSTGSHYDVLTDGGDKITCQLRGKFRKLNIRTTNPVAVGDRVVIEKVDDEKSVIVEIKERDNYIIRKSIKLSKSAHILAANVDRAYLLVTLVAPTTHLGFVDRFLVTAEAYQIPVTLLFNKVDLYDELALSIVDEWSYIYEPLGYDCKKISALKGSDVDFLRNEIKGQQVLLVGHSGVGKSTLINALDPNIKARTGAISEYHLSGQHTTTFAELYPLKTGGNIIDTPGIKGFGLVGFEKEFLSHYFPEMKERMNDCKFNNCVHINEPGCAIKEALHKGEIAESRYLNYISMFEEDENEGYRESLYR